MTALGKCDRTRAALYVPFPQDTPGEHRWRLIAHWLHARGLRFFLGGAEYQWDNSFDDMDRAVRRTLEAARNLDVAVVASGAVPALDDVLTELLSGADVQEETSGQIDVGQRSTVTSDQLICIEVAGDMADEIYELHEAAAELLKCTEGCVVPNEYQQALSILDVARQGGRSFCADPDSFLASE